MKPAFLDFWKDPATENWDTSKLSGTGPGLLETPPCSCDFPFPTAYMSSPSPDWVN